jgi:hypothetical protein
MLPPFITIRPQAACQEWIPHVNPDDPLGPWHTRLCHGRVMGYPEVKPQNKRSPTLSRCRLLGSFTHELQQLSRSPDAYLAHLN